MERSDCSSDSALISPRRPIDLVQNTTQSKACFSEEDQESDHQQDKKNNSEPRQNLEKQQYNSGTDISVNNEGYIKNTTVFSKLAPHTIRGFDGDEHQEGDDYVYESKEKAMAKSRSMPKSIRQAQGTEPGRRNGRMTYNFNTHDDDSNDEHEDVIEYDGDEFDEYYTPKKGRRHQLDATEAERGFRFASPEPVAPGVKLQAEYGEVTNQASTSKTFIRPEAPQELLIQPSLHSLNVGASVSIASPLHVGGTAVRGNLNIVVRDFPKQKEDHEIRMGRISIDLLGIEEISWTKRSIFLNVATELLDDDHPPPNSILETQIVQAEDNRVFWRVKPSRTSLPLSIDLPLNIGPGSFTSAKARIRYIVYATILLSIDGNRKIVRCYRDINIVSAVDPSEALVPLRVPLTVKVEKPIHEKRPGLLRITAKLHRTIWLSGSVAYVDVHVSNCTEKTIKKIRLKLVRHIVAYKNTIASADELSAGHLRAPSWIQKKTVARSELNVGSRWRGIKTNQDDSFVGELEVPRGQLSVHMGRYFEVKYFIDVAASTRWSKKERATVQLPVTIIPMSAVDIIPNSLGELMNAVNSVPERCYTLYTNPAAEAFDAPRRYTQVEQVQTLPARIDSRLDMEDETGHVQPYRPSSRSSQQLQRALSMDISAPKFEVIVTGIGDSPKQESRASTYRREGSLSETGRQGNAYAGGSNLQPVRNSSSDMKRSSLDPFSSVRLSEEHARRQSSFDLQRSSGEQKCPRK